MTGAINTPKADKLLPCPFCGHAECLEIVPMQAGSKLFHYVHCNGCGGEGPLDDANPASAWNARPETAEALALRKALAMIGAPVDGVHTLDDGDIIQISFGIDGGTLRELHAALRPLLDGGRA